MKLLLKVMLVSLLSIHANIAVCFEDNIPPEQIRLYMEVSGIDEMIDSMPVQIEAMFNQRLLTSTKPDAEKEVLELLSNSWDPDVISQSIASHITVNSSKEEINSLLEWRKDATVIKITAAEAESNSVDFQNNLLRYIAALQETPPSQETMKAVKNLVVATDMVDMMVEMTVQVSKAMISGFLEAEIPESTLDKNDLLSTIDSMRASMRPQMEQQAILISYYIYRNITNEELNAYASFYESRLGSRELKLVSESLYVAVSLWAKQSATAIVSNANEKVDSSNMP